MTFVGQPYHKNNSSKNNSLQFKSRFLSITKAGFFYYNQTFVYFNSSTRLLSVTTFLYQKTFLLWQWFFTLTLRVFRISEMVFVHYVYNVWKLPKDLLEHAHNLSFKSSSYDNIFVNIGFTLQSFRIEVTILLVLNAYFSKLYPKDTNFYV